MVLVSKLVIQFPTIFSSLKYMNSLSQLSTKDLNIHFTFELIRNPNQLQQIHPYPTIRTQSSSTLPLQPQLRDEEPSYQRHP